RRTLGAGARAARAARARRRAHRAVDRRGNRRVRSVLLDLQPRTFDNLVDIARSIIPTVAPAWTDHNTHDPGIMLAELMAWVAEAQGYALSRVRRDERAAYARL